MVSREEFNEELSHSEPLSWTASDSKMTNDSLVSYNWEKKAGEGSGGGGGGVGGGEVGWQ